ncbi:hypothetical protein [Pedobacter sp. Hv1]|uniref:hypothetical protein n=1 Tax=Pedobacter sp. Hv1 TaxID=1740090 RepID=UPI0006D8BBCB|nr:hypothetical protein [Pedobacter sp. Hv1]KQC00614.1 hypothetical protein AQF98_07965 [Pedobacter sp. Hv1]
MRNQNFRAEVQQTKQSGANRLEWGAHNPNLKAHHLINHSKYTINDPNELLADIAYDESSKNQSAAKR